jgi:hypothetical protein
MKQSKKLRTIVPLAFLVFLFSVTTVFASHHTPNEEASHFEGVNIDWAARLALLLDLGDVDLFFELVGKLEDHENVFRHRHFRLGSYFRVDPNLKLGVFYQLQAGIRHDDDWVKDGSSWLWLNSDTRWENVLFIDISPRAILSFIDDNLIANLKLRYKWNLFNSQHSILVRPGFTYVVTQERIPLFNFSLNYAMYFALNFSEALIYKHGPYLNIISHLSKNIKIETEFALETVNWTTSADSAADNVSYFFPETAFRIQLGVVFTP